MTSPHRSQYIRWPRRSNNSVQRYSGYDLLSVGASDVLSAAKYDWVQSAVHVTASGRELRMNSGKNQMVDLAKARLKNAQRTAANNMSVDIYSSGALTNQMGGLAHLITSDGTGTVGGIVAGTFTFWKNQFLEFTGTPSKTTIKGEMNKIYLTLNRGTDKPDLIVSSHDYYADYWESLQDLQRYTSDQKSAQAGFESLKYANGTDIVFDSNTNFGTTAELMYFLNTDYLGLTVHKDADWDTLDEKTSVNQDAAVIPIIFQGQMTCSNRSLQGLLLNAS